MPYKDKIKRSEHQKQYRMAHTLEVRGQWRKYYWKNKIKEVERVRKCHSNCKLDVLNYYGNGQISCVKCGYSDIRALSIDHINGKGGEHRRLAKASRIYEWLRKNNYPEGYQILCMNCQFIKRSENKECQNKVWNQ